MFLFSNEALQETFEFAIYCQRQGRNRHFAPIPRPFSSILESTKSSQFRTHFFLDLSISPPTHYFIPFQRLV